MSRKTIQKLKYQWREGSRYSIDANTVGNELARIQQTHGVTTPETVVNESRPEDAPLHPAFEWRDEVAAHSYRTWQARKIIKSVMVIHEDKEPEQAYVHVPSIDKSERGYQPLSVVVNRPDMYAMALAELERKLASAVETLESLKKSALQSPESDTERMTKIAIAVQAMQTASAAVMALH